MCGEKYFLTSFAVRAYMHSLRRDARSGPSSAPFIATRESYNICIVRLTDCNKQTNKPTLAFYTGINASCTLFSSPEDGTWPKYWNINNSALEVEFDCSLRPRGVVF